MNFKKTKKNLVIHYKPNTFLGLTENWIYEQIISNNEYRSIVYTEKIKNNNLYSVKKIRLFPKINAPRSLKNILDKTTKKYFNLRLSYLLSLWHDKPSIIHAHYGVNGYEFLPHQKIFGLPLVTTFYGYDLSQLPILKPEWLAKYKILFDSGAAFFVEGSNMKKSLVKLGCPEEKIHVHHLGVNLELLPFRERRPEPGAPIKILMAGRFVEKKGFPLALRAIGILKEKNPGLLLKITIIGDADEAQGAYEEKKKIMETVKSNSLGPIIDFLNFQPHSVFLKELYEHHIFLSPSQQAKNGDNEGGAPVSIIEASASGMPIVSTLHCDIKEVVLNGQSGLLVPENDHYSLYRALEQVIKAPQNWKKIGMSGRAHITKEYNSLTQAEKLARLYDTIILQHKKTL